MPGPSLCNSSWCRLNLIRSYSTEMIFRTTTAGTCSEHHTGYEEFGNRVRGGIEQALENDILTFLRKPGAVTDAARRRKDQFQRWFVKIFDVWYTDVTEASDAEARECLTDNFPYDSPGNLDKECVHSTF